MSAAASLLSGGAASGAVGGAGGNAAALGGQAYLERLALNQQMSPWGAPAVASHSSLSTIEQLTRLEKELKAGNMPLSLAKVYATERRFLAAAVDMITNSQLARLKFGSDMTAAIALAGQIKQYHQEKGTRELFDQYAWNAQDATNLDALAKGSPFLAARADNANGNRPVAWS